MATQKFPKMILSDDKVWTLVSVRDLSHGPYADYENADGDGLSCGLPHALSCGKDYQLERDNVQRQLYDDGMGKALGVSYVRFVLNGASA